MEYSIGGRAAQIDTNTLQNVLASCCGILIPSCVLTYQLALAVETTPSVVKWPTATVPDLQMVALNAVWYEYGTLRPYIICADTEGN